MSLKKSNMYQRVYLQRLVQIMELGTENIILFFNDNSCSMLLNLSVKILYSECPKECKEAVASLIYAAARFGDLPELRDLRKMFTEKYKDCLEAYTNKEVMSSCLKQINVKN